MIRLHADDPGRRILYVTFNNSAATEFRAKCPAGMEAMTIHSVGNRACYDAFRCKVEKKKSYMLLDQIPYAKNLPSPFRGSIVNLVGHAKNHAIRPDQNDSDLAKQLLPLARHFEIDDFKRGMKSLIDYASKVIIQSAMVTKIIDYDDMLWLPYLYELKFPAVDFLIIDECQDLNLVQHELAERMTGSGRCVIVGDPFQSIYAFRGADPDSMRRLQSRLDTAVLPLTVTHRCPRSHVDLARRLVPDFECAEGAPDGTLIEGSARLLEDAAAGDLVTCRLNRPLVSLCLAKIRDGVPATMRGRDFSSQLLSLHKKLAASDSVAEFRRALGAWRDRELIEMAGEEGTEAAIERLTDRAASMDAIARECQSPSEIPARIDKLFHSDDRNAHVIFSTIHRAKGDEANRVYYLVVPFPEPRNPLGIAQWEQEQRRNLHYVGLTRSRDTMILATQDQGGVTS